MTDVETPPGEWPQLGDAEIRVLGALMEKEATTPEYYPLTLNALRAACNQKSNRDPVVAWDEKTVARGLQALKDRGWARTRSGAEMRVPRHLQIFSEVFQLTAAQTAALCVLLLRGPQTVGEIRARSTRLHAFESLEAVEQTLQELMEHARGALVRLLPRIPGQKERRYAHMFSPVAEAETDPDAGPAEEPAVVAVLDDERRIRALEAQTEQLRQDLEALRRDFEHFKEQFE